MGMAVGGKGGGLNNEPNVVPMIDVASLGGDPQKPGNMTAEPKISIEGCTAIVVPTSVLVRW